MLEMSLLNEGGWHTYRTWKDGKHRKLEDQLNSVMLGVLEEVDKERVKKAKAAVEAAKHEAAERRRLAEEERRRQEEANIKTLLDESAAWHRSQQLRQYIAAVHSLVIRKLGHIPPGSEEEQWFAWASGVADRMSPLTEHPEKPRGD